MILLLITTTTANNDTNNQNRLNMFKSQNKGVYLDNIEMEASTDPEET